MPGLRLRADAQGVGVNFLRRWPQLMFLEAVIGREAMWYPSKSLQHWYREEYDHYTAWNDDWRSKWP